jgi:hypothetical protein
MATPTYDSKVGGDDTIKMFSFPLTTADHTGNPIEFPQWYDRVFTATSASWGAATVILEGSNDGVTYVPLKDATGTAISLNATNGTFHLLATPRFVRPRLSVVGVAAVVTAIILCRRPTDLRV